MSLELFNMICTRICHDVIGSSQGILQGVESLDDKDQSFADQSRLFIKDSAETLNAKLVFFRALCGRPGKLSSVDEVRQFAGGYLDSFNKRIYAIHHKIMGECDNMTLLKAGLALCCIATDTLIRGGDVVLDFDRYSLFCVMTGHKLKLNEHIHSALTGDLTRLDPKNAVAGYLSAMLAEEKLCITTMPFEEEIKFMVK